MNNCKFRRQTTDVTHVCKDSRNSNDPDPNTITNNK